MSNQRGYFLTTDSPPNVVNFPLIERFGSGVRVENTDIEHVAERGKRYVYFQTDRRIWTLRFRIFTQADYDWFYNFHAAMGGRETVFYFVPDVSAPGSYIPVRKEKDFFPQPLDAPRQSSARTWDYTMELTEEVDEELDITA